MKLINIIITSMALSLVSAASAEVVLSSSVTTGTNNAVLKKTLTAVELETFLRKEEPGLLSIAGTPQCNVALHVIKYPAVDGSNHKTEATTAVMIPTGGEHCHVTKYAVLYAHGTSADKGYDMSSMDKHLGERSEGIAAIAFFASRGFTVVAPNYTGYSGSTSEYHPYLNAEQQSHDMSGAIRAAHASFPDSIPEGGRIFITGYSQGAYVALATQRLLESTHSEFKVEAVSGGGGPYALSLLVDEAFLGTPGTMSPVFMNLIATSWQRAYHNVYILPSDLFSSEYSQHANNLLPSVTALDTLYKRNMLPERVVFHQGSLPGPNRSDTGIGRVARSAFNQKHYYLNSSYRDRITHDISEHPCNTVSGDFVSACQPSSGLRKDAVLNDLRTFTPVAPVFLCGSHADTTVNYISTTAMSRYLQTHAAETKTSVIDLAAAHPENLAQSLYQAEIIKMEKEAGNDAAKRLKLDNEIHDIAAPYCLLLAREFFIKHSS